MDLAPGASPGIADFDGNDLILGSGAQLLIEIAGTAPGDFDRVIGTGDITLGGTLDVTFLGGFVPTAGESFEIISFASQSGEFASVNGAGFLNNQSYLLPISTSTDLTLRGFIPGDGNLNDTVDAADYTVWANGFGTAGADLTVGDYNGNGIVDAADYTLWANNFGQMVAAPAGPAAAVPEPSTFLLAIVGIIGLSCCRRRRRR